MNQDLSASNISGVEKKLARTGPRRLLALDSGGIRGLITIEVLAEIERALRKLCGAGDDFVLADYFDYIGGTSVGAILAACLALGLSVEQARRFFVDSAPAMFLKARWWQRLRYKYRCDKLQAMIKTVVEGVPGTAPEKLPDLRDALGTTKLRTLLMLVMRNATTDSPWPVSNNPLAKYNRNLDDPACNLKIPLWQLIRASAAAPTFFPPEVVTLGPDTFVFDDGAMTPYGNPAFQLFLMATLAAHGLHWPTGEEKMLLVSVGTGSYNQARPKINRGGESLFYYACAVPSIMIGANVTCQDLLCRVFGLCKVGDPIDTEVGDLIAEPRGPVAPSSLATCVTMRTFPTPASRISESRAFARPISRSSTRASTSPNSRPSDGRRQGRLTRGTLRALRLDPNEETHNPIALERRFPDMNNCPIWKMQLCPRPCYTARG